MCEAVKDFVPREGRRALERGVGRLVCYAQSTGTVISG